MTGKKLWLRPGKRYLFGRTNYGGKTSCEPCTDAFCSHARHVGSLTIFLLVDGSFAIPDKTISRKHMVIELAAIPEGKGVGIVTATTRDSSSMLMFF